MTKARFLFNEADAFSGWAVSGAGNPAERLAVVRDGNLHTSIGDGLLTLDLASGSKMLGGIGVVNNRFGAGGNGVIGVFDFEEGDFILRNYTKPNEIVFGDYPLDINQLEINPLPNNETAYLMVGDVIEIDIFYPRGWQPVFIGGRTDKTQINNNGLIVGRYTRPQPVKFDIPIRYIDTDTAQGDIKKLIKRLQTETCLYQPSENMDAIYCWAVGDTPQYRYMANNILETTIKMAGYVEYE